MNVSQKGNAVLAMDVARDDEELLVVTENGYGKRTSIPDYPVKGRGTMGVKTITLTENKGALAGALVVREHQELVFISQNGMVQRTSVRGINRYGRASQGVRVMNIRDDDQVSAVALMVESEAETAARVVDDNADANRPPSSTPTRTPPTRLVRRRPEPELAPGDRASDRGPRRWSSASGKSRTISVAPQFGKSVPRRSRYSQRYQRKEVVRLSDIHCGTLEVSGR